MDFVLHVWDMHGPFKLWVICTIIKNKLMPKQLPRYVCLGLNYLEISVKDFNMVSVTFRLSGTDSYCKTTLLLKFKVLKPP